VFIAPNPDLQDADMKTLTTAFVLLTLSVLAGCASHVSPEQRPYTAEESRELAMEALNRRGLSFDEYHAKKAELLGQPQQKTFGFDKQGEMNAERAVQLHGRPS
jgi:acyl-[acyl carrier protein]--UDP-N-acetylglucosamine O-acyltransferase